MSKIAMLGCVLVLFLSYSAAYVRGWAFRRPLFSFECSSLSSLKLDDMDASTESFFMEDNTVALVDSLFQLDMKNTLARCGYRPQRHESDLEVSRPVSVKYLMENQRLGQKPSTLGEVDAAVTGDFDAFQALCSVCPIHWLPERSQFLPLPGKKHFLTVEGKVSARTFINAVKNARLGNGKSWWLRDAERIENDFFALFLDGGEETIDFILHGKDSAVEDVRQAARFIEERGLMVFFLPSFSLEWVRESQAKTAKVMEENAKVMEENAKVMEENAKVMEENARLLDDNSKIKTALLSNFGIDIDAMIEEDKSKRKQA